MAKSQKSTGLNETSESTTVRLNKYLADCGVASRRRADELITEGAVLVNGKKVYELGTKITPGDRITVSGKPVKPTTNRVYILFHKPKQVVTTMNDPEGRPSISDFFERLPVRVFPVGRLDWDTEGMILLTNDGEFAQKVNHPSKEILKTYLVKVDGHPSDDQLNRLRTGVSILGGRVTAKAVERLRRGADQYDWIKISISEGKNRQVRRMFEKIGFDVLKLQRIAIGYLRMPSGLKRGEYVFLTEKGLEKIFEQERKPEQTGVKPMQKPQKREAKGSTAGAARGASSSTKPMAAAATASAAKGPKKPAQRKARPSAKRLSRDLASRR
jgi:23S rRNA pseudouridine2605 synthase